MIDKFKALARSSLVYGLGNYAANKAAFNASLRVCTPLTSDTHGTVYFGVRAGSANPLGIGNAIAAVDASGNGRFVSVSAATSGASTQVVMNCAPALSADESTLYIGTRSNSGTPGYLVALATADFATRGIALLRDPVTLSPAFLSGDGTASPMVGPDGKVYYGVLENPSGSNGARGWLLAFDATLAATGPPGSFGWDDTPSLVPASAVPSYAGASPYLLMTKYNSYAGIGPGDGVNQIAILDPGDTQPDVRTPATIMKEVLVIAGVTPDLEQRPAYPQAVREWCINTALVDPFTHSVLAGSEDGVLYRWSLATNSFSESITLTPGIGEAYTPTVSGPDGQVYAINNATLFAVGATSVGVPAGAGTGGREVALSPARPNPFVAATTLRFSLAHAQHVTLEVLDLAGQRVASLYAGMAGAGEHVVRWDGRDAAGARRGAGVYFARISAGGASLTRELLLLR